MFNFVFRRKRNPIPQAYRALESSETTEVAGGVSAAGIMPGMGGGNGAAKDPNG